ncbi:MAG TPA: HEAT repeat domain-containing protein [Blastocatellia bacterium]|nr:HEAT repeat domain-containing protein [Blastocatellia bacterium]
MPYKTKLHIRLIILITLLCPASLAIRASLPDLPALTKESSLIVVGKIVSVQDVGEGMLSRPAGSIPVQNKIGRIQVSRILKGQAKESTITFDFVQTITWYGIRDVRVNQVGMFFLKPNGKNGFTVTSYYDPFVVAAIEAPRATGGAFERVLAEVTNILALPQSTWVDKFKAIDILEQIETPTISEALRLAAKSENMRIRLRSVAALLRRNDISELGFAEKILSNPPNDGDPDYLIGSLANSLHGVKDPKAIPSLARLLKSHYIEARRSSALALRRTGSDSAIDPFTKALYDNDREVRYHAVMGLAEITRQYSWAPARDKYDSNEQHYLNNWRDWAAKR